MTGKKRRSEHESFTCLIRSLNFPNFFRIFPDISCRFFGFEILNPKKNENQKIRIPKSQRPRSKSQRSKVQDSKITTSNPKIQDAKSKKNLRPGKPIPWFTLNNIPCRSASWMCQEHFFLQGSPPKRSEGIV